MKATFNVKIIDITARKGTISTSTSVWLGCPSENTDRDKNIPKRPFREGCTRSY